jgi:hypothetical protein
VVTGARKRNNRTKTVGTFVLGTQRLYDFVADNPAVELWPATYVNDPRRIAGEPNFVSINATVEVDLAGQCASETIAGRYWSSSGGQADFARGAMYSEGGQAFVVCRSTADEGRSPRSCRRSRRHDRHDAEEHGRQDRHRVGRRRAARAQHPGACCGADIHRPSRSSRPLAA